jgi:hypothetical protein
MASHGHPASESYPIQSGCWHRCSEGIGEGAASAARTPRSSSAVHPYIHASVQASKYVCVGGVGGCACACVCVGVYARACAGRASKRCGGRGHGGSRRCHRVVLLACLRVFALARACVCVCVWVCAHAPAFVHIYICLCLREQLCSSRFEARCDACSVQAIIGHFRRRDGGGYSAAAPDTRRRRMLRQPAMHASAGA